MGTEGEWTTDRMPGYTGFIPGSRHIYGRSFGRTHPLGHVKEKKTELYGAQQEAYVPKNDWQVLLPPIRFIPGYTGHLPGRNFIFGKTFAQEAEECFTNLSRRTEHSANRKLIEQEINLKENGSKPEAEVNRNQAPVNNDYMREEYCRDMTYPSPEKAENSRFSDHYPNKQTTMQNDYSPSRNKNTRYDLEAKEELTDRAPKHHMSDHQYRTQSNDLSRYSAERRNPDDLFRHLKYESPLKPKHQTANTEKSYDYPSKYDQRHLNQTNFTEESRLQDQPYDYKSPDRITSKIQSRANEMPTPNSKFDYSQAVPAPESKYSLSTNFRSHDLSDQSPIYTDKMRAGDKHDECNLYNTPESVVHHDAGNFRDAPTHYFPTEVSDIGDTKNKPSYTPQRTYQDQRNDREYSGTDYKECSCCTGHGEVPKPDSQQLDFAGCTSQHESEHGRQKPLESCAQVSRSVSPVRMSTVFPDSSENLQQSSERIHKLPDYTSALSLKGYDRSRRDHKSVKFEDNRNNISPMDTIPKAGLYRTSYNDYGNSTKYFDTSLNPPISGYRGYLPRMNSTSALGVPFATHIGTNIRT